jgi:hypothetical protein
MALATTVTGDGKAISGSTETGSYSSPFGVSRDGETKRIITTYFTEIRTERKWYALTGGAIDSYIAANPTANVSFTLVNEVTQAYEMTVTTVSRTITQITITNAPEEPEE